MEEKGDCLQCILLCKRDEIYAQTVSARMRNRHTQNMKRLCELRVIALQKHVPCIDEHVPLSIHNIAINYLCFI